MCVVLSLTRVAYKLKNFFRPSFVKGGLSLYYDIVAELHFYLGLLLLLLLLLAVVSLMILCGTVEIVLREV